MSQIQSKDTLAGLRALGALSDLDAHFAGLLGRLGKEPVEVLLAAALASHATGQGHVCLSLSSAAEALRERGFPVPADWARLLRESPAVGSPGEFRPLVLDGEDRLYLYRYWQYERALAADVLARAGRRLPVDRGRARAGLGRLFLRSPELGPGEADGQKVAAAVALLNGLCIVSGGPGTGKTTAVVKILALLQEQAGDRPLRVALSAPTGKAAARIQLAVRKAKAGLAVGEEVRRAIPEEAATLHRLLGIAPGSAQPRHRAGNPLPHDVVVVDEVSMVDLALLSKLAQAVRPDARLILLGDGDQLASVEAGAVLGDLCDSGREHACSEEFAASVRELTGEPVAGSPPPGGSVLADCLAVLRRSYRFRPDQGIGRASRAVNTASAAEALEALRDDPSGEVSWRPAPGAERLAAALEERAAEAWVPLLDARDPVEAFARFERFRILCARREGPQGVEAVNRAVELSLARRGRVDPSREWYAGRPVLVTRNDHALRVYNGDVGICLADPAAQGALRVFFVYPDGAVRSLPPLRLPPCETAYAMTVHKSQGSEFEEVLLLLGAQPSRVLTRELLYTGLTRARTRVEVWGTEEAFLAAASRRVERTSGLREALWGREAGGGWGDSASAMQDPYGCLDDKGRTA